ncbi:MAG: hypothetical protein FWH33_00565 [Oscillospiraceae bacterium]|nr:hypothetical protein [Oscillospiraceae bacterium]
MIAAAAMTEISVPRSLWLSVLGILIVFLVLVFLMVIIIIMTAIIRKAAGKTTAAALSGANGAAGASGDASPALDTSGEASGSVIPWQAASTQDASQDSSQVVTQILPFAAQLQVSATDAGPAATAENDRSAAEAAAVLSDAAAAEAEYSEVRKFKVVVDGVEYEVDAAVSLSEVLAVATASEPDTAPEPAAPEPSASADRPEGYTETRRFRVVVDGVEYEVDAEIDEIDSRPVQPMLKREG